MTSPYYNPSAITPNTRAMAEQISTELAKIAAAFAKLPDPTAIGIGGGAPNYTWYAYADSADGTANFTNGEPGNRTYVGIAANQVSVTESPFPADYTWAKIKGADGTNGTSGTNGTNGTNGIDGGYREFRFVRSIAPPTQATGSIPAGTSTFIPVGDDPVWVTTAFRNGLGNLTTAWDVWSRLTSLPNAAPYSASTTYYDGMQALYQGGTYILIVRSAIGIAPTGTAQANGTWDVVSSPGTPGAPATPPSAFSATINLTSASAGINLATIATANGYSGMSNATITFRVGSGVTIGANPGGLGVDSGVWPDTSYAIAITFEVQSGGIVYGGGGIGGDGGTGGIGSNGSDGGDGVYCRTNMTVLIDSGGALYGGGGGGGGGKGSVVGGVEPLIRAGGGGGGGAPNGYGGVAGSPDIGTPTDGATGTTGGGGAGGSAGGSGTTAGGAGGGLAAAGSNATSSGTGGGAGYAVRKNGRTVTVTNNGTMGGTVG